MLNRITRRQAFTGISALLAASWVQRAYSSNNSVDLSQVTLRVAKYKGGWDLLLESAGLSDFPYTVAFAEFAGGNLMIQAINAGAIDLASCSEIPPIFALEAQNAVKIIAATKGPTIAQTLLVPANSTAQTVADLKGKKVGFIQATTAHYFLIKMLEEVGLTFADIEALPVSIADGLTAFSGGNLDAWATYGYAIQQAKTQGARELRSAADILSGNFAIVAAPDAIEDPKKSAAIADFLCRLKQAQDWQQDNIDVWGELYAKEINVSEDLVLNDLRAGLAQRRSQLLPISDDAIASQQLVADTFAQEGIVKGEVDVRPLWDPTFTDGINKCV